MGMSLGGVSAVCAVVLQVVLGASMEPFHFHRRASSTSSEYKIDKMASFLETSVIPDDYQVSSFLYKGKPKLFLYLLQQDVKHLSITLTPCTSVVEWAVRYRNANATGKVAIVSSGQPALWEKKGQEAKTFTIKEAKVGLYTLQATSMDSDSYIELFVSSLYPGGHPALQLTRTAKMAFTNRRAKGELTVRWEPSAVDPSLMNYWLVVSSGMPYWSLCDAKGAKYGVKPPPEAAHNKPRHLQPTPPPHLSPTNLRPDTIIEYAGKKKSVVVKGLVGGRVYNFDLFAVISGSNLSFVYGSSASKYHKGKPLSLRDASPASVNIRRLQGRATFRYKVKNTIGDKPIDWYIMPCGGGSVDAEIRLKDKVIVPRKRVEGYGLMTIQKPIPGARYILKLNVSDPEELSKVTSVEVMGSRKGLPLPEMPTERRIHEYTSLQGCSSVTIGWLPILHPGPAPVRYCVRARELHLPWYSPVPDHCALEASLNMLDFQVLQCQDVPPDSNRSVITEQVNNLKPGRTYELQVTVKKPKTKMLSYQILPIHTKSLCR